MDLSFASLSSAVVGSIGAAGMHAQALGTAAVASAQGLPASAAAAAKVIPNVASGAMAAGANALPGAVQTGMAGTTQLARDVGLVEKPISAAAKGTGLSTIGKLARGLSRTLPWLAIGASAVSGAQAVQGGGAQALITTKQGRGAVLGAVGGALLLVPIPPTQIAASVVLAGIAANEFGLLDRFDRSAPIQPAAVQVPARPS